MSGTIESQLRYHAKHPDTPPPLRGLMLRAVEELRYRAMVIEQRNAEIKRGHDDFVQAITDPENQPSQWGTVTLALAQQGAQQPVAWYEYNQDLDAWFLAYGHNPKAKTRPLVFGDTAAPAPQPAQGVPEVGFGNMPYSPYLFGGLRFKMNFDKSGNATNFHGVESALQGAWVALVDATDNRHLQSAQPVAQPLSDSEIEKLREKTFSTYNPYCPVDSKSMRKAVRAAEAAHGIGEVK